MEKYKNEIILTEGNFMEIFRKLSKEPPSQEELSFAFERFKELVNYNNTNGTKI